MRVRTKFVREHEFGARVQFVMENEIGETEWIKVSRVRESENEVREREWKWCVRPCWCRVATSSMHCVKRHELNEPSEYVVLCTYAHVRTHTHMHICTHKHTQTHTDTHTHTHTHVIHARQA